MTSSINGRLTDQEALELAISQSLAQADAPKPKTGTLVTKPEKKNEGTDTDLEAAIKASLESAKNETSAQKTRTVVHLTPSSASWTKEKINDAERVMIKTFKDSQLGSLLAKNGKKVSPAVQARIKALDVSKLKTVGDLEKEAIAMIEMSSDDAAEKQEIHTKTKKYLQMYAEKGLIRTLWALR